VSELRIRSEAFVDQPVIDSFVPPVTHQGGASAADLGPLIAAASAALGRMLGAAAQMVPASEMEIETIEGRGGQLFAALLLTLRLGGAPSRATVQGVGGNVLAAYHAQLLGALTDAVSDPDLWPRGLESLAVSARAHGIEERLWLQAPPVRPVQQRLAHNPHPRMMAGLPNVPMRLAVELAATEVSLLALLPLRIGQIIPIAPAADMALRMDGHVVGKVSLSSRPDGRQEALLVALDLNSKESRS